MTLRQTLFAACLVVLMVGCALESDDSQEVSSAPAGEKGLNRREVLGKRLFDDTNLSVPTGTSCGSCHSPTRAFAGNNGSVSGVPKGSTGVLGLRNSPSIMYGSFTPTFALVADGGGFTPTGGQFLDGRVDTLSEQAKAPLLSPDEMNNPDAASVVAKVAVSTYAELFKQEWGSDIFTRTDEAFEAIAQSLQAFERNAVFHPFSSRYDEYLRGRDTFTASERRGMSAFFNPAKGNCAGCHAADPRDSNPRSSLFTDFTYDNLGVPRNDAIPANADPAFFDLGLGGPKRALPNGDASLKGAFKVPTLRNVAVKEALFHNGVFTNLDDLVDFYVTRDTDPGRWFPSGQKFNDLPVALHGNVNTTEAPYDRRLGDAPRLTESERRDLVDFLRTLTDREFEGLLPPPMPAPRPQ